MLPNARKTRGNKKPFVYQPFLKGRACSLLSARRGLRVFLHLALSAGLFFILGQFLVVGITWLRILLNLTVLAAFYAFMFRNGAQTGERDVIYAEIALSRAGEGRSITRDELNRCFHPAKGFFSALMGALPFLIACLVYALLAQESRYTLGSLPFWLSAFRERSDIGLALSYYNETVQLQALDFLRLLVRLLIFPYVNFAGAGNSSALLLIDRLSPLLLSIAPLAYGIGYSQGEHYRSLVHGGIAANRKRVARQQKKKQQPSRREPRQLV
jgi:hypothetical protein